MGLLLGLFLFGAGLAGCSAKPPETPAPAGEGKGLYDRYCLSCHGDEKGGNLATVPPHNRAGHTWHHPDPDLVRWTLEGRGSAMPGFQGVLSEGQVVAILDYIKTWWTEEQRAAQADITQRYRRAPR